MKRMKVLFGQRRMMVLATLAILVLAAAALAASSASFTATSANVDNIFTAGTMELSNTSTLADIAGIMPDGVWHPVGRVTLGNTGDKDGALTMTTSALGNTPGSGGGNLSDVLQLRVTRVSDNTPVYTGDIDATIAEAMGTVLAGSSQAYDFEVMFPDGDGAGPAGADNAYKLSSMTIAFDWSIVNL